MNLANSLGVQIYADRPLVFTKLPNVVRFNPYKEPSAIEALKKEGVVFFRDSLHTTGAIACTSFKGKAFVYQFYVDKSSGLILQVAMKHVERDVEYITEGVVKMVV